MSFLGGKPLTGDPNRSLLQQGCLKKTLECLFSEVNRRRETQIGRYYSRAA